MTSSITSISRPQNGSVYVEFGGGSGLQFSSVQELRDHVEGALTPDAVNALLLARALGAQPELDDPQSLVGLTVVLDPAQPLFGISFVA